MKFHTPPENQGQIVTVSYGWLCGGIVRHTFDASDRSETFRFLQDPYGILDGDLLDGWEPWNTAPPAPVEAALDAAPEITRERIERMESA
jgi:hypothetical protein